MQLSYLSMKSVLKYLKANLRIEISVRCPSFQVCDKTCPIHIRQLWWNKKYLKINETYYKTTILKRRRSNPEHVLLGLEIGGRTERVVSNKTIVVVMNYILKKILGGRQVIAKHTCIGMDTDAFQNSRNLVTDTLEIFTGDLRKTLDSLPSIFHPSTFPLKSLRVFNAPNFKHPIIQTAQKLIVPDTENINMFTNKRIHAQSFHDRDYAGFINAWLGDGKEVGTHFSVGFFWSESDVSRMYDRFLYRFKERVSWRKNRPPGFAVNIDNFSEIVIDYEEFQQISNPEWRLNFKVRKREAF